MKKMIIVNGMSCEHCVRHVTNALNELSGVTNVTVNLDTKTVILEASADIIDKDIRFVIDDAGYEVVDINVQ